MSESSGAGTRMGATGVGKTTGARAARKEAQLQSRVSDAYASGAFGGCACFPS